jgi:hypothetical protein
MRGKSIAAVGLAFAAGLAANSTPVYAAFGYCSQPMAPTVFMTKPSKPYCAASRSCSEWDIQRYRNDIDRHFDSLKRYAGQVEDYYSDAQSYIKCMADLD